MLIIEAQFADGTDSATVTVEDDAAAQQFVAAAALHDAITYLTIDPARFAVSFFYMDSDDEGVLYARSLDEALELARSFDAHAVVNVEGLML